MSVGERFWSKVDTHGPIVVSELGRCRIWTGSRARAAMGSSSRNKKAREIDRALQTLIDAGRLERATIRDSHSDRTLTVWRPAPPSDPSRQPSRVRLPRSALCDTLRVEAEWPGSGVGR